MTNSITNTLGIKAEGNPIPTFQEALDLQTNDKLKGGSRTGWQADYPSLYNFLGPTMGEGSSNNYSRYDSKEFDELLAKGRSAATVEEGNKYFHQAQEILFQDLPAIPLWYSNVTGVWNADNVSNVKFGWNSVPLYYEIESRSNTGLLETKARAGILPRDHRTGVRGPHRSPNPRTTVTTPPHSGRPPAPDIRADPRTVHPSPQ